MSPRDIIAGVSVALVLIPQSLAYASLAGLPPHYGLYAAMLPPIAAAFFVSSPYLQTGPVAMTSILTFGALSALSAPLAPEYAALAALLALLVGTIRVILGWAKAGWVAFLMSQPVLNAFTGAAAFLIICSQLPTALGLEPPTSDLLTGAWWAVRNPSSWDLVSVGLAALTIALVLGGRRLHALFPAVLVAVVLGISFSALAGYQGAVIGDVPRGLPPFSLALPWRAVPSLLVPAGVIALVGFAEASAISRIYAAQDRSEWSPDREFISQGVANLAAGLSGGFPVGGSFSRSSVNRLAGGRSRWSGAVTGLAVLAFLPFASVLSALPRAVLGAIVIAAVLRLVNMRPLVQLFRMSVLQAATAWVTFALTIVLAPRIDLAVLVGIALAILIHLWRELRVHVGAQYRDSTLRIEPKGVLFFASAPGLERTLLSQLAKHPEATSVILDLKQLGRIDYTGAMALKTVADEAEQAGLVVTIAGAPPQTIRILRKVFGKDAQEFS